MCLGAVRGRKLPPGGGIEGIAIPGGVDREQFADAQLDRALELGCVSLHDIGRRRLAPGTRFDVGEPADELGAQRRTLHRPFVLLVRATLRTQVCACPLVGAPLISMRFSG